MHDFPGDDPFNRNAYNAVQAIADYRGYESDHYRDFNDEAEEMTQREIERQMAITGTYLVETITDLTAVHVFNDKIIIVDAEGNVTTYPLAGGGVRTA